MSRSRSLRVLAFELFLVGLAPACGQIDDPASSAGPDGGEQGDDGDGDGDSGDDDTGGDEDATAPTIVSVSPEDGEAGLREDTAIEIAFSEPMDEASVEAAFSSDDLPPVTFDWSAAGDAVTITPDDLLVLAEGSSPKVVQPIHYTFAVADSAADRSGNHLAAPLAVDFTTSRRISVPLERNSTLTRSVRGDGVVYAAGTHVATGDLATNVQYKAFVTFDLPILLRGAEVESATMTGVQQLISGSPYSLGTLSARHTAFSTLGIKAFAGTPIATLGVFSASSALGPRSLDVTAAVKDDLANRSSRGDRTQVRLEFPVATDKDDVQDATFFAVEYFSLVLTYLVD